MQIPSFAKINLFLQVTGKRADGYHLLKTLMCPIDLQDTLEIDFNGSGIQVTCSIPDIPRDEANLAGKAARSFYHALAAAGRPEEAKVSIHIDKRIPAGAGLGGGSSNAATVLTALNKQFGSFFSTSQLMEIGGRIGADVPFFIFGKPAIGLGIGTELHPVTLMRRYSVLLVHPGFSVSTSHVYGAFKLGLTKCEGKLKNFFFEQPNKDDFDPALHLCNDLETVTETMHPEIKELKTMLMQIGAVGSLMSGSGSTVFGLFENRQLAEAAENQMMKACPNSWNLSFFLSEMLI
jgi:4-diphosphocytidyl-2-C-methyl-D-erythritol kinase